MDINLKKMDNAIDLPLPHYQTTDSAGVDLYANVKEDIVLKPMERKLIGTGIALQLPKGYEAQVRARSGLALKNGITTLNGIGTIDADYRGEVGAILINLGQEDFVITRGMRICQLVINKYETVAFNVVEELDETVRGEGGFGHTGRHI